MKNLFDINDLCYHIQNQNPSATLKSFINQEIKRNVQEALKNLNTIYDLYDGGDQIEVQEFRKDIERVLKHYE